MDVKAHGRIWQINVRWTGPALYWFGDGDGNEEFELGICYTRRDVIDAIIGCILDGDETCDWTDWHAQRDQAGVRDGQWSPAAYLADTYQTDVEIAETIRDCGPSPEDQERLTIEQQQALVAYCAVERRIG